MAADRRIILHVDMDAFFATIEQRDRPELRGRPVIVGARPEARGVVATASYEARRFGVHSALPSSLAAQRCPQAVFVAVRHEHYEAVSRQVMRVLGEFTPDLEPVSIDEAFLDLSHRVADPEQARDLAATLKQRLRAEVALTGSVGIAPNKFLAKLASDLEKPDGLTLAPFDPVAIRDFLAPLPVSRIWGVGPATAGLLHQRGLRTIGDLQQRTAADLVRLLGLALGQHVHCLAFGRDDRPVVSGPQEEKSISHEETFAADVGDREALRRGLLELTEKVGRRLRRRGRVAGTIQVKLRFADFRTITRQVALPYPTAADRDLRRSMLGVFERLALPQPVRLIGVGVAGLQAVSTLAATRQPTLFATPEEDERRRNQALDEAVDAVRERFGERALRRGV